MNALHVTIALFCIGSSSVATAESAGNTAPVWRVEYMTTGQPPIPAIGEPNLAVGPAGIYAYGFAEPGALGSVVAKIDATTASVEWSAIAPLETERGATFDRVVALPDGPLSLAGSITMLDSQGNPVWSIPRSADYFFGYGTNAAALVDSGLIQLAQSTPEGPGKRFEVTLITPTKGETLDRLSLPAAQGECRFIDLVNVEATTSYVASNCVLGRLLKLNLFPLSVEWTMPTDVPEIDYLRSMRADDSGVYVAGMRNGSSFLRKLSPADASPLWMVVRASRQIEYVHIDTDGNPVVHGGSSGTPSTVEKFDAATGASLWVHENAGNIKAFFGSPDALVVAGSDHLSPDAFDTRGFVERIDPATGISQWRSMLTSGQGGSSIATSVVQQGDRLVVAGTSCALPNGPGSRCAVSFWRASASSNAAADGAQSPAQIRVAAQGLASVGSDDSVYAVVNERNGRNAQLRVTRHRKSDGTEVWTSILPIEADAESWRGLSRFELKLTGDGNLVILEAWDPADFIGRSDARVIKIGAVDGATMWTRELIDPSIGQIDVSAGGIASDQLGNVFVPVDERYVDTGDLSIPTRKRVVRKLSSSTGESLWRVEFDPREEIPYYHVPVGYVAGNNYLAVESPLPTPQRAWTAIDGATGTVLWSNPALPVAQPAVIDADKVVVAIGESVLRITRFSPSSGTIAWQTDHDEDFGQNYLLLFGLESEGVLFLGGSHRTLDWGSFSFITRPIALTIQASTGAIEWVNSFEDIPDSAGTAIPRFIADGHLYLSRTVVTPLDPGSPFRRQVGSELTSLSQLAGNRVGSQLLHASRYAHPHLGIDHHFALYRAAGGRFFTLGEHQVAGSPLHFTVSSWTLPSLQQIGSLVVSLSASVQGAGSHLHYTYAFTTQNQGDVPAENVLALLGLPIHARSTGAQCTLDGAPCAVETTATSIEARVDLPPASVLRVQGSFEVPGGDEVPHRLLATAFAAPGFVEVDLSDNVGSFSFTDRIFRGGFE